MTFGATPMNSVLSANRPPQQYVAMPCSSNSYYYQIPAVKNGGLVADSDNTLTLSISAANVLSIPYALDNFVPMLGRGRGAGQVSLTP